VELTADRRTARRLAGDRAEELVARHLIALGWNVLARNVRAGRHEVDLVAIEPGDPPSLVFLEVRSRSGSEFGAPEESVVGRKARGMYRAALELIAAGTLPDGRALPKLPWRVDLICLVTGRGSPRRTHLRGVEPA
jgi:putative endonuclease